ncbi:DUF6760 family protein [Candidatus Methanoperedens nitratireducens]|uniref:DUF6760 family protein n=1 Tax=Candidatus Methanoperedens nitratireducens TaxID=1392998 RepID=UPI0027BAE5CA|nr:DUF6760 family protein [Candidatus Methanoperedens nitroreducens]
MRDRGTTAGGIAGYPLDRLYEEVAFLAYYLHWDHETIMNLEHRERQQWCEEVSKINKRLNPQEQKNLFDV